MRQRADFVMETVAVGEEGRVSVKASSGNGLTDFGRGDGIAASVVVLVDVPEEGA